MNSAYVYLQLYKLFDNHTPVAVDCGELCSRACCTNEDAGMYLFPGEKDVYKLLNPSFIDVEKSDFTYEYNGKTKYTDICFCNNSCDRYQRPLACRIFPLTPYINKEGRLEIIVDPRAKSICPLAKALKIEDYERSFVRNVKSTFVLLSKNSQVMAFLKEYSRYLDEYLKFFK